MARVDVCTSCGRMRTIRRKNGKCDTCYIREDYRADPAAKQAMDARTKAWKAANKKHLAAYMKTRRASEITYE